MDIKSKLIKSFVKNFIPEEFQKVWEQYLSTFRDDTGSVDILDFWKNKLFESVFIKVKADPYVEYLAGVDDEFNDYSDKIFENNDHNICLVIQLDSGKCSHNFCLSSEFFDESNDFRDGIVILNENLAIIYGNCGFAICEKPNNLNPSHLVDKIFNK